MTGSYYELLGVEPDASREEIETAYRETIKQVHPDKNDSPDADTTFIRVQQARSVLTDPERRERYDRRQSTAGSEATAHRATTDRFAYDGSTPTEQTDGSRREAAGSSDRHRQRRRWTDRFGSDRTQSTTTHAASHTKESPVWYRRRPVFWTTVWGWCKIVLAMVVRTVALVRTPRQLAVDRSSLRATVASPTGIRLGATIAFVLSATIVAGVLGLDPYGTPLLGLAIVVIGLVGSYTGYDLLFSPPDYEPSTRKRSDPDGTKRLWPIAGANLLAIGLTIVGLARGAPTGGIAFTAILLLPVIVALAIAGVVRPTLGTPYPTGIRHVIGVLAQSVSAFPVIVMVVVVFTRWGLDTPAMLASWEWTSATPWIQSLTLGGVYVGLLFNLCVGVCVCVCLLWSVYAMCVHLTAAPWTDRYSYGYQIRPGPWNLLVAGPFVVVGWMVIGGVSAIELPIGVSTVAVTQQGLLMALFLLPSVLTGLYILRRRLEPKFL